MKITDIKINLIEGANTKDAQQFVGGNSKVILRIDTDEGIYGLSEGGRNCVLFLLFICVKLANSITKY